jgi:hypothetical protein
MDESTQNIDLTKAQETVAALIASTFCNGAIDAFLEVPSDLAPTARPTLFSLCCS